MDDLMGPLPPGLMGGAAPLDVPEVKSSEDAEREATEARKALVEKILSDVKRWESKHEKRFKKMKADTRFVANADNAQWDDGANKDPDAYVANITHRAIQQKVANLYAKNPRAKAERAPRVDYSIWDGRQETLSTAMNTLLMAQQAMQVAGAANMGMPASPVMPPMPQPAPMMDPMTALSIVQEAAAVRRRRDMIDRIGKTCEILFHHFIDASRPRFKSQMKQAIRRAATCGVAWIQLDFERKYDGHKPETETAINDTKDQIKNMMASVHDAGAGDIEEGDARAEELRLQLQTLMNEPDMIVREGPVFDFPKAWDVIPDDECKQLIGFVGCKRLARRFQYTPDQIKARFNVDLQPGDYTAYVPDPRENAEGWVRSVTDKDKPGDCVWYEVYDSTTGLMYSVCEGYKDFLCEPDAPRVKVEQYFPFYPIVLNEVENDCEDLYPPSDVDLIRHQQREINRSREALRQHRIAAQPFWVVGSDKLSEDDQGRLRNRAGHDVIQLRALLGTQKVGDVFQAGPTPALDPNLYNDAPIMADVLRVSGTQEANLGPTSGNTATEAGIAETSRIATVASNVDDIDDVLSDLADDTCAVMLREMSPEIVKELAGDGAIWPENTAEEYIAEISLKIVAGSMGKPNRDRDAAIFERIMPIAVQVPGINPEYLAKKTVQLLDEAVDMDDAVLDGIPSVLAMNTLVKNAQVPPPEAGPATSMGGEAQPSTGNPQSDPAQQGAAGAMNMPTGPGVPGGPQAAYPAPGAATGAQGFAA